MEILLISNDTSSIEFFRHLLKQQDIRLVVKSDIRKSLKSSKDGQIMIIDCEIADGTCLECLESMVALNNDILPIVILQEDQRENRIEAFQKGAFWCIYKPLQSVEAMVALKNAIALKRMKEDLVKYQNLNIEALLREKLSDYLDRIKDIESVSLYDTVLCEVEKALVKIALNNTNGNKSEASKLLGLNRNTLRNKIKKYRIGL